jgi:hypothetical protein
MEKVIQLHSYSSSLAPLSISDKPVWRPGLLGDLKDPVHNLNNTDAEFSMEINTQELKLLHLEGRDQLEARYVLITGEPTYSLVTQVTLKLHYHADHHTSATNCISLFVKWKPKA